MKLQHKMRKTKQTTIKQNGVTLIELLVALVIGLVVSLAVYTVLTASEGRKRTTTSVNDIDQGGSFASYQLDKSIRSAGSGFSGGYNTKYTGSSGLTGTITANYTYGCALNVAQSSTTLLPAPSGFPAPFAGVSTAVRLAPIVIIDGTTATGDTLISMTGSGGMAESITNLTASPSSGFINVTSVAGVTERDRILLIPTNTADSGPLANTNCLMSQVKAAYSQATGYALAKVDLAGTFYTNAIGSVSLSSFPATTVAVNFGKLPMFNMYAVGANNTLFKYDLLSPPDTSATSSTPNPGQLSDGVYSLEAVYGISTAPGSLTWQTPTGAYAYATLLNGSATSNANLQNIVMIRVALVMRTSLFEKNVVSPDSLTLFGNTTVPKTIDISASNRYRFRVVESTIPIRNALIIKN